MLQEVLLWGSKNEANLVLQGLAGSVGGTK